MTWLDILGYVASIIIAVSLMMSNIKRLRWINLVGAGCFSTYGLMIGAYPVFVLNGSIVLVNVYNLIRLYRFQDDFDLVRLSSVRTQLFELLLKRYGDDIRAFFPNATLEQLDDAVALLIFRNMKPDGIFAYRRLESSNQAEVLLDYVLPKSRDLKTAAYLFAKHSKQLKEEGITTLVTYSSNFIHIEYLTKMGFVVEGDHYRLEL